MPCNTQLGWNPSALRRRRSRFYALSQYTKYLGPRLRGDDASGGAFHLA